ncbi:hypothetical protein V3H18_11755 [Methylocystis sp. 9N]|uniref:Spore protein YkvP/CgeB glycosyl transferase-like domain-containing protein n=1 Tax=Methylocystis borbori TaxID=3118750 RepID=A0ABU7XJ79_9HYPH
MTNILYLSAHAILERDEVILLQSLGYNVYSPQTVIESDWVDARDIDKSFAETLKKELGEAPCHKSQISDRFLEVFDIVICEQDFNWLHQNRQRLKGKRAILRTLGQLLSPSESQIVNLEGGRNFEIVRCSPAERTLSTYAGEDAVIRFYKDPARYHGWTGEEPAILGFGNILTRRPEHVSLGFMLQATAGFDFRLYGAGNAGLTASRGMANSEEMPSLYRTHRIYYSHHTIPASYTLSFLEGLMTGAPVVTPGPEVLKHTSLFRAYPEIEALYEVPQLIKNKINGFTPNTIEEAQKVFASLLADQKMASEIGAAGRTLALELFGMETIREQWKKFLG